MTVTNLDYYFYQKSGPGPPTQSKLDLNILAKIPDGFDTLAYEEIKYIPY